jgi:hypothetical protein
VSIPRRAAAVALTVALALLPGAAAPTGSSLATTPHGDLPDGSIGGILALGQGRFLACSSGPDGNLQTADDRVLLVENATGMPTITVLATPGLPDYSGHLVRLTATRALITGTGPNLTWKNADDVVYLLDGLGSTNTVTGITVGFLNKGDGFTAEALGPDSAVVFSLGPNAASPSSDDEVVVLTSLGGMNIATHLAAPRIPGIGRSKPTALSPTSFLIASDGADDTSPTADDLVYLFTNVGTAAVRTDIAVPRIFNAGTGRPVRLSATRALVSTTGTDTAESNADDAVRMLDALGTMNVVTPIAVGGGIWDYGAGVATAISADLAVISSNGPDGVDGNSDDGVVVLSGLGASNTATFVTVGNLDEDAQCRPVRMADDSCAFAAGGPAGGFGTMDDEVVLVTGLGTDNALTRVTVGGLSDGTTSKIVPLAADSFMVATGGADFANGNADDKLVVVSDAFGTPLVETVGIDGAFAQDYGFEYVPVLLGGGVAVLVSTGPDLAQNSGGDDRFRIIQDLPGATGFTIKNAKILFKEDAPEKGEKVSLKAKLSASSVIDPAGDDVIITLGDVSQVIPAGSFVKKGANYKYSDPTNLNGIVTKVIYKPKSGSLVVKAKGLGTGVQDTDPDNVAFSLESGDNYFGQAVVGTVFAGGIKYRP